MIGSGFLARNLTGPLGRHDRVTIYAAGPSGGAAVDGFARDADLLYATIAECLADGSRLVYLSTSSVGLYGHPGPLLREDGPVYPCSPYGRHKLAMEAVVRASGVDHLIPRLAYPVGPHQPAHQVVPALAAQVRTCAVTVWRGAKRDLIDVFHVAAVIDALLVRRVLNVSVNIASGTAVPVESIVAHLAERLGARPAVHVVTVPEESAVSVERLHALVPEAAELGFGPDYYRDVLDRYLPAVVAG
jgi:nucleoside-diphosphate-sugar epimerase